MRFLRSVGSLLGELLIVAMLAAPTAQAAEYFVAPDGSGDFPSLEAALDASSAGDTVNALPGTHHEQQLTIRPGVVLRGSTGQREDVTVAVAHDLYVEVGESPEGGVIADLQLDLGLGSARFDSFAHLNLQNLVVDGTGPTLFEGFKLSVTSHDTLFRQEGFGGVGSFDFTRCTMTTQGFRVIGNDNRFDQCDFLGVRFPLDAFEAFSLVLTACSFEDCTGSVELATESVVEDCTFLRCVSDQHGAIYGFSCQDSRIRNCIFRENVASAGSGGALDLWSGRDFLIEGCQFEGNAAAFDGGAIRLIRDRGAELRGNVFWENTAGRNGGAVAVKSGRFGLGSRITPATEPLPETQHFRANDAGVSGGGLYVEGELFLNGSDIEVRGQLFVDCSAPTGASVALADDGDGAIAVVEQTTFQWLREDDFGSMISADSNCRIEMESVHFVSNPASGGVFLQAAEEFPPGSIACTNSHFQGLSNPYDPGQEQLFTFDCCSFFPVLPTGSSLWTEIDSRADLSSYQLASCGAGRAVASNSAAAGRFECPSSAASTCEPFGVYVTTDPVGLALEIDGEARRGGAYVATAPGQTLSLAASDYEDQDGRYTFVSWSDDGAPSHDAVVQDYLDVFTAEYSVEFDFSPSVSGEGSVTPDPGYYPRGTQLLVRAIPAPGWSFERWEDENGNLVGLSNPAIVSLDSPDRRVAVFLPGAPYELELVAGPGGSVSDAGGFHEQGQIVEIAALPDPGYEFLGWVGSGDGSYTGPDNPAFVTMNGPITQLAEFRNTVEAEYQFSLSASDSDPFLHSVAPSDSLRRVYLWLTCATGGLTALEAGVEADLPVFGFDPAPGVFNIGSPTELLLAVGGCPVGPEVEFLLGSFLVFDTGGTICLGPSATNGVFGAVDCDPIVPQLALDPGIVGFASAGMPCDRGLGDCGEQPVPVRLSNLRAEPGNEVVHVRWQTTAEVEHAGFRVYRAASPSGPWEERTAELYVGSSPYDFVDDGVLPDRRYFYSVGAVDTDGGEVRYGPVEVVTPAWRALETALAPVRPNPFTRRADIAFSLAAPGPVRISIFDVRGRLVRQLVDEEYRAGEHVVLWNGRDSAGRIVPAGVYFSRLVAEGFQESRKLTKIGTR